MTAIADSRDARAPNGSVVRLPSTSAAQAPVGATPIPPSADVRDSYAVTALADVLDRSLHAVIARFTAGLSPAAMAHAYLDWATHLAYSPGKRLQLMDKAVRKAKVASARRVDIDAAVKQMKADASEAEARLQKLKQAGSESWTALAGALAESRKAFDRANQAAWDALKHAASPRT